MTRLERLYEQLKVYERYVRTQDELTTHEDTCAHCQSAYSEYPCEEREALNDAFIEARDALRTLRSSMGLPIRA